MPSALHEFKITPVYDDSQTDYFYSRVTYLSESIVNGQSRVVNGPAPGPSISYQKDGPGESFPASIIRNPNNFIPTVGPVPQPSSGIDIGLATSNPVLILRQPNLPPLTHSVIRQRLSQPQGQLYIFNGPGQEVGLDPNSSGPPTGSLVNLIIASPLQGYIVDCNNGPKPHLFDVIGDYGDGNSYVVVWGVETFINEATLNGIAPALALLSNRFSQGHSVDDEGFTTITTTGTAIFRSDLIYANQISPDSLRASMFIPIPLGFTRHIDYVRGLESSVGITYGYTDTQVKSNFVAGPYTNAVKINAVHRQAIVTDSDLLGGVLDTYERHLQRQTNKELARERPRPTPPKPVTPGGPSAGRLRVPGVPPKRP